MNRDCFSREKCNGRGRKMVGGGVAEGKGHLFSSGHSRILTSRGRMKNIKTQEK